MNLADYVKPKYVVATYDTYNAWIRKTKRSKKEYILVSKPQELRALDKNTTEVYFVGNYWKAHSIEEKLNMCKEYSYKIIHIDSF